MQQLTQNTLLQGGKYRIIDVLGQGGSSFLSMHYGSCSLIAWMVKMNMVKILRA